MIDKNTIYSYFQTDDFPTEEQFRATWDSFWHKSESIPMSSIPGLNQLFQQTATVAQLNDKANVDGSNIDVSAYQEKLNITNLIATAKEEVKTELLNGAPEAFDTLKEISDWISDDETAEGAILQAIQTEAAARTEADNLKLNKPTTTSNTTSYPYVVGENGNGGSARLPAGDLGKNFFNADLSNTTARNHTMNAGVTVNTLGNPHTLAGLPNKNADIANFRKVRVQNASGLDAVVDSKNMLIDSVSYLTDTEKLNLTTSLNGGYSSATMSVGGILPINVSNFFNELTYVTLIGNNLNLNPSNFSVKILDINNNVVADVSSQSSINNVTSLTFWFNFYNFPTGIYKVRLTNGLATLTTTTTFEVNNQNTSKSEIDTSTLTWLEASNVGAPFINNYQKGTTTAGVVISSNATGIVIGNSTLKSSPIINTADYNNFYLAIEGNANYISTALVYSSNIAQIGIVKNPTNVVNANESINLGVQLSGGGNSGMNTNSFGSFPSIGVNTKPSYFKLYIIKRQNSITYILQIGNTVSTIVENIVTDFKIGLMIKGTPFSNGSGSTNSFYITNISGYTF